MTVIKTRRRLIDGRLMSRIDTSSLSLEAADQLIDPDGFKKKSYCYPKLVDLSVFVPRWVVCE